MYVLVFVDIKYSQYDKHCIVLIYNIPFFEFSLFLIRVVSQESCHILDNYLKQKTDEDESKHVDNIQKDAMLELVRTEKEYVANLSLVVKGYMAFMEDPVTVNCSIPVPEDLKINSDKYKLIFVNIKQIYECHRE